MYYNYAICLYTIFIADHVISSHHVQYTHGCDSSESPWPSAGMYTPLLGLLGNVRPRVQFLGEAVLLNFIAISSSVNLLVFVFSIATNSS